MVLELVERGGGVSGKGCGAKYGVGGSEAGSFIDVSVPYCETADPRTRRFGEKMEKSHFDGRRRQAL